MKQNKDCIIIKINNNGEEFAQAWADLEDFSDMILEGGSLSKEKFPNFYYYCDIKGRESSGSLIANICRQESLVKMNGEIVAEIQDRQDYTVYLWIKDCAENDVIEYQYLALMMQNMENFHCFIYPDDAARRYVVYRNVSCFFSFFVMADAGRRNRLWVERDKEEIGTIRGSQAVNEIKIVPMIEIDRSGKELQFWMRPVKEFLNQCAGKETILQMESFYEIDYYQKQYRKKLEREGMSEGEKDEIWRKLREGDEKRQKLDILIRRNRDSRLLCHCLNYFVKSPVTKSIRGIKRNREIFQSQEFLEIVKDIPLLAFYMLCMQRFFLKKEKETGLEEIKLLLVNVEELVDGMFQLLENIHHSSNQKGVLSIRIHESANSGKYLQKVYPDFGGAGRAAFHYEFRILDYSRKSIIESFQEKEQKKLSNHFGKKFF